MRNIRLYFLACLIIITFIPLNGQDDSLSITERIFKLGEVTVSGKSADESLSIIRKDEIINQNYQNVAEILEDIPGVVVTNIGARNESTVFLRGYDTRQITLLVDGVPVYIPFDGNIDLGRFLSWNYEKVVVSKGFASMLYGPNAMGGAVNLVTSEPKEKIEIQAAADVMLGNKGYNGNSQNLKIGSKTGDFFFQGSFSRHDLSGWDLSNDYEAGDIQPEGERINSFEEDLAFSFRMGYHPNNNHKYVISYARQDGEKGIPVYDGQFNSRFWRMPEWNKRNLYFSSMTGLGKNSKLVSRIYYDIFQNTLESFDDESFTTQDRNYAFTSIYDDYSLGGSLKFTHSFPKNHTLALALFYKNDNHLEFSDDKSEPITEISDNIISLAVEDEYKINKLSLKGGVLFNYRKNASALQYYEDNLQEETAFPSSTDRSVNFRAGAYYTHSAGNTMWLTTSMNSRFATMKERYSFRLGRVIPNPGLGSERTLHFNAGHKIKKGRIMLNTEIFYSLGKDKIEYVSINPDTLQYQNIENTRSFGIDFQLDYRLLKDLKLSTSYSYLKFEDRDNKDFYFINIPEHSLRTLVELRFFERFLLNTSYTYVSERNSYIDGSFPQRGYGLVDLNVSSEILENLQLKFSINNLLDVNYFYAEGYPARGRMFRLGLFMEFAR